MLNISSQSKWLYLDLCDMAIDAVENAVVDTEFFYAYALEATCDIPISEGIGHKTFGSYLWVVTESLALSDTDTRAVTLLARTPIGLSVAYPQKISIEETEKVGSGESLTKSYNAFRNETVLNGSLVREQRLFDRFIKEFIGTQEGAFKSIYKPVPEIVVAKDSKMTKTVINLFDETHSSDNSKAVVQFARAFGEEIAGSEITQNDYNLWAQESNLSINCYRVLPNPCGVLSDIRAQDHGLTLADFNSECERVSGYNAFSEFKAGEYEYQDALYRLTIKRANTASTPVVYDYKVHVDIDDVKDRGTANILAEETKVYFNRHYYTEPEVVVNVVSGKEGEVVIPFITETNGEDDNGRYFKVILKTATGAVVAGTISWNSNGY